MNHWLASRIFNGEEEDQKIKERRILVISEDRNNPITNPLLSWLYAHEPPIRVNFDPTLSERKVLQYLIDAEYLISGYSSFVESSILINRNKKLWYHSQNGTVELHEWKYVKGIQKESVFSV